MAESTIFPCLLFKLNDFRFMKKPPSSVDSIDGFVEQCAADMINYKLGMVDLDYHSIAEEVGLLYLDGFCAFFTKQGYLHTY